MKTSHLLLGVLTALALPTGAQAATIAHDGDTLVVRASPGNDRVYLDGSYNPEGRLRIESSDPFTAVPPDCTLREDTMADCTVPARLRVELGAGDDLFGELNDMPFSLPIEVLGGDGDDVLHGMHVGAAAETLDGGPGNDRLDGYGGDDVLRGGPGNDDLNGNAGNDQVFGDEGDDVVRGDHQAAPGADLIDGGPGIDRLEDYVQSNVDVHPPADVSLDGVANDGRPGEGDNVRSIERMVAYVSGTFVGTDGAENWEIWSNMGPGRSVVRALGGDDVITGGDQDEEIDGGPGDDRLEGGRGHDKIIGGPGRDVIYGDETANKCNPEFPESCVRYGNDVIDVRDGEVDQVDCGPGIDKVIADEHDVVAANCETVERKAACDCRPDPGKPTKARLALIGRPKLASALRKGVSVKVTGARAGVLKLTARRSGRVVATGRVKVRASGTATVRLRFSKAAAKRLRRARDVRLTITGGGLKATVRIRR
jgi:hypothetical protein